MKFLVYMNVGKLARLLRMMGYDALLFQGHDDGALVKQALAASKRKVPVKHVVIGIQGGIKSEDWV